MTKSPSPSVDEVALPLDCKMRAGSRYASDLDCYKCGLGEGQVCPEYQAFAEASIAAKKAAHQVSPDNEAAEALQIALNREGILFSLDRCARLACVVAASLVSPPKAGSGEAVAFRWRMSASDHWSQPHAIELLPSTLNDGREIQYLYANHEARGDGVRVTDDLFTHREAWRTGLVLAKHSSQPPTVDMDDRAYWQHEIDVFDRVFAALEAALPPLGDGRAEIVEALKRAIDKHIDAAPVDGINAEGNYNLNVFNQQQSYVDGLKVARLAAIRSLSNPGGGLS